MKAIFGLMALVVVLAIVANLAQKNLFGLSGSSSVVTRHNDAVREASRQANSPPRDGSRLDAFPGAVAADPGTTVPHVSTGMQQRAVDRTTEALKQGAERNQRAAP
jgi:hypothetical protein